MGWFIESAYPLPPESTTPQIWSPYELAKFIEQNDLQELIKVSTPALYKNIARLQKNGFLMPYSQIDGKVKTANSLAITEKGRDHFKILMEEASADEVDYRLDLNACIVNLDKLSADTALAYLNTLEEKLAAKGAFLAVCQKRFEFIPLPGRAVIRQNIMLNDTMLVWLRDFIDQFQQENQNKEEC